ncbi:MAG TPA: hypothetical protein VKM55_23115 [Candidatus Lokiarchaeia archaeon]|nr:hypothetical protein [Candidatus Lokiarchaeia archaeon]
MGRIIKTITIKADPESEGEEVLAAFDTGAERSYIKRNRLPEGVHCTRIPAFTTGLGGSSNEIKESCTVIAELRGLPFDITVHPVNKIGAMEGKEIDIIVGATTMEQWEMIPNLRTKELDISGLEKREFTEF